ncbi:MAG: glycoside hydrolase family 3 C-terminal domain-containing protein [Spirochaetaceae bacterium]|jgi:beta-glucosidase|nr:glycoside hydrolase family 3 C-terminal domain-containing protein [Spirochaetaceae bacterium]
MADTIKEKARALVASMTLEEKVSQMVHKSPAIPRLGIPAYNWWNEALHGVARAGTATVFPQSIALAATFNPLVVRSVAETIATEGRAKYNAQSKEGDRDIYKGLTFWSPNINIFRDPRWGRGHETFGEDPFLTGLLGMTYIRGLQGKDKDSLKVAACAKHFAVHSGPENGRHSFNAEVDSYDLWNTYLSAFEDAVKIGVEAVMGAYNRTLGEPCCGSEFLLKKVLREKWGFDGHVVSDCWAIKDFHENHHVTSSAVESVALAVKNGCDVNCGVLFPLAYDAVKEGLLDEARVDEAVTRLVVTRMRLGILGGGNSKWDDVPYTEVDCEQHSLFNLNAAAQSFVLLKNNGVLPLNMEKIKTLGVIGPNADNRSALEANYSGRASRYCTPLDGIRFFAEGKGGRILYAEGCHLYKDRISALAEADDRISEARIVAKNSDVSIVFLGLDPSIEGEEGDAYAGPDAGGDKSHIELPGRQAELLKNVLEAADGKPVIVVSISGGAVALNLPAEKADALIQAFYPGSLGGEALSGVIFGRISPSGKLPVTFYKSDADLPPFTDYNMKGRTYRYFNGEPLYPFGYGLTYSTFEISNLKVNADVDECSVTVKNTGSMRAREVVQIYTALEGCKERFTLCGVEDVKLDPGEEAEIKVNLGKTAFARYNEDGDLFTVVGEHIIYAGFSQPDEKSVLLRGQKPVSAKVVIKK